MQTAYDQNHVVRHRLKRFMCWVVGDDRRNWDFNAIDKEQAEKLAARNFGVSELRVMSKELGR